MRIRTTRKRGERECRENAEREKSIFKCHLVEDEVLAHLHELGVNVCVDWHGASIDNPKVHPALDCVVEED